MIVILADDLGYGDLGVQGATDLKSPHLDKLASESMTFKNAYANCPVCSPTRAALLTGRYQELVGVPGVIRTHPENSWGWLTADATMIPVPLKKVGYHSAIVGKWHLGLEEPNIPNSRGFDFFHGFLGDMMDDYYHHKRHNVDYMHRNKTLIHPKGHATDIFTDWAIDYIKGMASDEKPFFLYLAYNAPHTPIQPPADWLKKVMDREKGISEKRAKLVALIEHMDDGIGKVLAALKASGQEEETIVVFTSDNGGQLNVGANNGRWRDGKQSMYEGGLRVPFFVKWPGHVKAGSSSDLMTLSMDIFPTLLEIAGSEPAKGIEGRTFLPALMGKNQPQHQRDMHFTRREGNARYQGRTTDAVIRGEWKLLQNSPFEPLELYNLKNDPEEKNDLAKKVPKKFNELSAVLRLQIQRGGQVPWQKLRGGE
ncbi:sulfatase-like hydrolase/transferase [Verrucomicrobia bacterium]|nr:sulfatase-like hydrolase/transferase [Verrucomicrobiota bacterium]